VSVKCAVCNIQKRIYSVMYLTDGSRQSIHHWTLRVFVSWPANVQGLPVGLNPGRTEICSKPKSSSSSFLCFGSKQTTQTPLWFSLVLSCTCDLSPSLRLRPSACAVRHLWLTRPVLFLFLSS
jgi:hypothetical protein